MSHFGQSNERFSSAEKYVQSLAGIRGVTGREQKARSSRQIPSVEGRLSCSIGPLSPIARTAPPRLLAPTLSAALTTVTTSEEAVFTNRRSWSILLAIFFDGIQSERRVGFVARLGDSDAASITGNGAVKFATRVNGGSFAMVNMRPEEKKRGAVCPVSFGNRSRPASVQQWRKGGIGNWNWNEFIPFNGSLEYSESGGADRPCETENSELPTPRAPTVTAAIARDTAAIPEGIC
ncbi:hypothetical protein C8R45DRAFT_1184556 [Mycena sanguinolenta]|nr:hypothetical protein C8R45DRAFT_1184556 [Mycena sanguinolenta]